MRLCVLFSHTSLRAGARTASVANLCALHATLARQSHSSVHSRTCKLACARRRPLARALPIALCARAVPRWRLLLVAFGGVDGAARTVCTRAQASEPASAALMCLKSDARVQPYVGRIFGAHVPKIALAVPVMTHRPRRSLEPASPPPPPTRPPTRRRRPIERRGPLRNTHNLHVTIGARLKPPPQSGVSFATCSQSLLD